jgi:hypothetical protein
MKISDLRAAPVLPDEYFAICEELEGQMRVLPLMLHPHNLASLHAALALEILSQPLRAIGEREVHARRQLGLPLGVTNFTGAIHAVHRGITILFRAIDNSPVPDALPVQINGEIQDQAAVALKTANGLIELFTLLDDVAIGWRSFEVEGHLVRAPSKSLPRLGRSISRGVRTESEQNEPYLAASAAAGDTAILHRKLFALAQIFPRGVPFEPDDAILALAETGTHRAEELLSDWIIPAEVTVARRFAAGEYRTVSEAVKAYAGVVQIFDDYREPRDPPRLPVKTRADWIEFIRARADLDETKAGAILDFLTHARSDLREGGRSSPNAAHTPFLGLGDGRLVLVPTLAIWQDGHLALRTIWKTRMPDDYNAKVSGLNHALSETVGALFASKGWPRVVRRQVPGGGDIDAGTGSGDFFIIGECKVFIDDPVRGADDPQVWRELERNVQLLEDPDVAARVLERERLSPRQIVGLIVVPGRAQSPLDFGQGYALVGVEDLKNHLEDAATPQELWATIKAGETEDSPEVVPVTDRIGPWTIESDGVRRVELTRLSR